MFVGMGCGGFFSQGAHEGYHFDQDGLVIMQEARQFAHHGNLTTKFLVDFADDGDGGILPGFDLAAREFPLEWQMLVRGTLGDEQPTLLRNHGADNGDGINGGHADFLNKELRHAATFLREPCFPGMNTFLKVLLLAALLIVAIKFSPVLFIGVIVGLILAALLGAVSISLVAALLAVVLALAVALSPIWIPVLVVLGLISLFRKNERTPPAVAA